MSSKMSSKAFKSQKRKQLQNIRSEITDPALNGELTLSVTDFLKSRKYEITELEKAQLTSKFTSSTRVFQHLPRKLRRRTASHNVKRIPKRLRNRAIREMNKNDTPTTKSRKPKGQELYRLRTLRSLLRLAGEASLQKLIPNESNVKLSKLKLRQRIKAISRSLKRDPSKLFTRINNKVGSYDISEINKLAPSPIGKIKFMKRQRNFVWLNSHIWHAKRSHMIKRWGFQIPSRPTQKCFRLTHRNFNLTGGITWDRSFINTCVLQSDNQISLIELLKKVTKADKIGKKYFANGSIFDKLVYSKEGNILGSITILAFSHNDSFRLVLRVHPSFYTDLFESLLSLKTEDVEIVDNRFSIGSIDVGGPIALSSLATILKPFDSTLKSSELFIKLANESSLPDGTLFSLEVKDPRVINRKKVKASNNTNLYDLIIDMKTSKSNINNEVINNLFTATGRTSSYKDQLSLKDIEHLKKNKQTSGSKFPVLIYKTNGIWTVLMPWFWLLPIWYQLNHIAHMNHGGLFQTHQLQFENNKLYFPDDYPFTKDGIEENALRSAFKKSKWNKKPNSKKFNYDRLKLSTSRDEIARGELGNPFGCDWRYLQLLRIGLKKLSTAPPLRPNTLKRTSSWDEVTRERKIEQLHDVYEYIKDARNNDEEKFLRGENLSIPVKLSTIETPDVPDSIKEPLPIVPISLTVFGKGNPSDNARIYAIPPKDLDKWIMANSAKKASGKKVNAYPPVPTSNYLVGFITSGSYNLSKGKNTGIGSVDAVYAKSLKDEKMKYCLVRNVGTNIPRLALWNEINFNH